MEKEEILSTLTEKLGQTSFSQQSLQTYVENNLPDDGAEPDEAYWSRHVNVLKSFQGQFNHDVAAKVTEQAAAKEKELEDKYKAEPKKDNAGDVSELKAELKKLQEKIEAGEKKETQAELTEKVKKAMRGQNASDEYVLDKALQGVNLDATKSIEDLTKEMLLKYDKEYKACRGEGAEPRSPKQMSDKSKTAGGKYFERKKAKEKWGQKK